MGVGGDGRGGREEVEGRAKGPGGGGWRGEGRWGDEQENQLKPQTNHHTQLLHKTYARVVRACSPKGRYS